jgi:hypothetical protein
MTKRKNQKTKTENCSVFAATHNRLSRKKTQTTHRMLGMLIFKKSIKFGIRKKLLRRGKVQSLLDLSLSKEI